MSNLEVKDLRTDFWGNSYPTAGDRVRNTEKLVDMLKNLEFPKFESEIHTPARVYEPFTFVHDSHTVTFVSTQKVPSGVSLDNTNYWIQWVSIDADIQEIVQVVTDLQKTITDADVSGTSEAVKKLQQLISNAISDDEIDKMFMEGGTE